MILKTSAKPKVGTWKIPHDLGGEKSRREKFFGGVLVVWNCGLGEISPHASIKNLNGTESQRTPKLRSSY